MDVESCHIDFISELPQEIIEIILNKLPVEYAVRTCILSRSWRYKWASMTYMLFDHCPISTRFINGFMSKHDGPTIHKFTLFTYLLKDAYLEVDRWSRIVCQKDVKELTLRASSRVRVPGCIFSCTKLTRLALYSCALKPPPPSFAGFSCVKRLVLSWVSIPREDMERLISSCPLLESLKLAYCKKCELDIRAPKLRCLKLKGSFRDICLEKTPLLVDVAVNLSILRVYVVSVENLLGGVPKLERLRGKSYFMHSLSGRTGGCKFITYEFLKHIELRSFELDNPREVLVLFQLIFSSPNLQELYIQAGIIFMRPFMSEGHFSDWFQDPLLADGTLNQLKQVEINGVIEDQLVCMELIKFLLKRTPSLVTMCIGVELSSCGKMRVEQLLSFPRASPKASIVFIR